VPTLIVVGGSPLLDPILPGSKMELMQLSSVGILLRPSCVASRHNSDERRSAKVGSDDVVGDAASAG
jgi:hypothetical protein